MGGTAGTRFIIRLSRFGVVALSVLALACADSSPTENQVVPPPPPNPPPPPPAPVPLVMALSAPSRSTAILAGSAAPADSITVSLTGDASGTTGWTAVARHDWTTLTSASGTGSGMVRWTRNAAALAAGIYVDTITVTAPGVSASPLRVIDTLQITTVPVPLALALGAAGHRTSAILGTLPVDDSVAVTITGTGAAQATWTAAKRKSWTTLTTAAGTGSGLVRWTRSLTGLASGIYVDTITVTAPGISGGVVRLYDTLEITPPLLLQLGAGSRRASLAAGGGSITDSVVVTLSGTGAGTALWNAGKRKAWTTLTTASGTGSGKLRWTRNAGALAAGIYVDTLTVGSASAVGSPLMVIDTFEVTAVEAPPGARPDLGAMASFHGIRPFPDSDPWNTPVDNAPVDPNSLAILSNVGLDKSLHPDFGADFGGPFGIPYIVVPDNTPRYTVPLYYDYQSDPGPYPIPPNPPLEGGGEGDSHLLVITRDEFKLYELFDFHAEGSSWTGGSGAIFDLIQGTKRPEGWTSADAAGLPIFPGLVRYDEVYEQGEIRHALRFTITRSRMAYVPPATHWASASTDPTRPPMGMRVRLKASVDISGYPEKAQVILRALKKYGMMVADNGGDFFISGSPDARWDDEVNNTLKNIKVKDFEVVKMVGLVGG